ncbi:enoyl-[acyl-carrier-protein] reductase, mitochondrial-like [Saccoglossus kowalevskii]
MAAPMITRCGLCLVERCMISSTHAVVIQSHVRAYSNPCALKYSEYGDPSKVVQKTAITLPYIVDENSVLVKMIAAPVNPADINTIQGLTSFKYFLISLLSLTSDLKTGCN